MNDRPVLCHVCCGPCLIFPLKKLRELHYAVTGYYYNPNIFPLAEYEKRRDTAVEYARRQNVPLVLPPLDESAEYEAAISPNTQAPERCQICWTFRLNKTAQKAKEMNLPFFTTTLLVSPYQDALKIKSIGEAAAGKNGVGFFFYNFQEGYQEAVQVSKTEGLYRQKYCGCRFSLQERGKSK